MGYLYCLFIQGIFGFKSSQEDDSTKKISYLNKVQDLADVQLLFKVLEIIDKKLVILVRKMVILFEKLVKIYIAFIPNTKDD